MPSVLTFERQKMSVEMWEKLKSHIMRQREKRKQEKEQDAEQERNRREQELKRKRDATTLEDIKDQLGKLESKLSELRAEKHELFLQLKKVLHEDEIRKRQKESELLAAQQAIQAQQQIGQNNQYNPYLLSNSNLIQNSRLQVSNLQQQQHLHQQLYQKLSPITTGINLSTAPSNIINSVITQSSSIESQQQPQQLTSKRLAVKRPHERSPSPQPNLPYTGILPNYKTSVAYTSTVSRIGTPSQQVFYSPHRHIPVSQPPIPAAQLSFDGKSNAYFLPSTIPSGLDATALDPSKLNSSAVNAAQINQQQISQLQHQDIYQQHLRLAGLHNSSLIPIQSGGQVKQGGISGGFPVQRPSNSSNSSSANNSVASRQFSRYQY